MPRYTISEYILHFLFGVIYAIYWPFKMIGIGVWKLLKSIAKETHNAAAKYIGGIIALAIIGWIAHFFIQTP